MSETKGMTKIMKQIKILFTIAVVIMILLPILNFNIESPSVSEIDNRNLTELDFEYGGITDVIDSYIKDRIGFRSQAINFNTRLNDKLFGEMVHPTYTYGKYGEVFFKLKQENIDKEFVEEFCKYLKKVQLYCKERGVPFIFCLNPGKISVYSEMLPKGYSYKNQFIDYMEERLEKYNINYISNYDMLRDKSKEERVFNKEYDVGHWNDLGAFYGINSILSNMHEYFPKVRENKKDDFFVTTEVEESLPVSYFEIDEEVPFFYNKDAENIDDLTEKYAGIKVDKRHPYFLCTKNTDGDGLPNVLFFRGSYIENRTKFIESRANTIFFVHNYENFLEFEYYFNISQPDCVILETAEYATTREYFDYEKMTKKTFNKPLSKEEMSKAKDISEYEYEVSQQKALVEVTIKNINEFSYGYLLCGGKVFDLQVNKENKTMQCVFDSKYYKENDLKIVLY